MTERRKRKPGAYVPDEQRHTAKVTVRMPPEEAAWWREEAARRGRTLAELMTEARAAFDAATKAKLPATS